MSDIRVSVQWRNATVFAGEEVECKITFKNVAQAHSNRRTPSPNSQVQGHRSNRERWRETLPLRSSQYSVTAKHRTSLPASRSPQTSIKAYKQALSFSAPHCIPDSPVHGTTDVISKKPTPGENRHRRSVSIVSIGGDASNDIPPPSQVSYLGRPGRGHTRAASLQIFPKKNGAFNGGLSPVTTNDRASTLPSPLFRASTSFAEQRQSLQAIPSSKIRTAVDGDTSSGNRNRGSFSSFRFPHVPAPFNANSAQISGLPSDKTLDAIKREVSPRSQELGSGLDQLKLATRILSPSSIDGTPRSSVEFYSMSNNSTETLASEYITHQNSRLLHRPGHSRQSSCLAPTATPRAETLMMGYGQLTGSFTLDGSLVNQGPFEEVKGKGIIGGQGGGGVVRNKSAKRDSGLLGSLGWSNLGESFGGLLGGSELSSIKEAKDSTSAKSIPILSTPQSILFVDLKLGPGESKSYTYRNPLPKGIPPSHKGKAIKVSYSLVVGTQRAASVTQQHQVQRADIPFRVLTSVNGQGEILGHDLMSPRTILFDTASISIADHLLEAETLPDDTDSRNKPHSSLTDFVSYVDKILQKPCQESGLGLLSPTESDSRSHTPLSVEPSTMKESVDLAILKCNASTSTNRSANRFAITRSGVRVAVIMLARPAYRLGETVPVAVDFQGSEISCFSLHATLETSETIDPAIALRSKTSVLRVTRRIHASQYESTISARKVLFNPMIPTAATPEFITSGINLEWRLRFEFVTNRLGDTDDLDGAVDELMEEVAGDERGIVQAAVQGLPCETFDVAVPLRVYGATEGFDENIEAGSPIA